MALSKFRRRSEVRKVAEALYEKIVAQARQPEFYLAGGVPDTVDGRFELISLHAFLVMRCMKESELGVDTAQALFDHMFDDMDRNLREMGVGDLGVGRRVKTMAKAFYGRISAYDSGLDRGQAALCEALERNLYGTIDPDKGAVARVADYVEREYRSLQTAGLSDLFAGNVSFGPPPQTIPGSAAPAQG